MTENKVEVTFSNNYCDMSDMKGYIQDDKLYVYGRCIVTTAITDSQRVLGIINTERRIAQSGLQMLVGNVNCSVDIGENGLVLRAGFFRDMPVGSNLYFTGIIHLEPVEVTA